MRRAAASPFAALALAALGGCGLITPSTVAELPPAAVLPDPSGSWLDLGRKLLADNQPVQAERAFIRSLRVEGMTAAAFTGAGVAAQRQGLLTEAKRYFERAKEIDPSSVAAHNNLGAVLYGLGELHPARHAFRTAFALSSGTSEEAARNLAQAELAISRAETDGSDAAEPAQKLQRTGSAEYKLFVASEAAESG